MSTNHARNTSEESTASSYNMILEHLVQYPASYEIPLRTMYALNCTPLAQMPKDLKRAQVAPPIEGQSNWNEAEATTVNFTSQLINCISSVPNHNTSLPPSFVVNFVSRVFHPSLSLVDFPQALAALDYLKDLEQRRKREMTEAFSRVGITPLYFETDTEKISKDYPGIALWANNLQGKDQKAEFYYAKLWLGVRRWIMINELSLTPFNKLNCMSMLNTLLPPQCYSDPKQPSKFLNPQTLKQERDSFFDYIQQVQKQGPTMLTGLMEGETTKWEVVQKAVDKYLRVAKNIIDDCSATLGTDDFKCVTKPAEKAPEERKGKKTDSGVSFASQLRPGAGSNVEPPRPVSPAASQKTSKSLSKLERVTREFKRYRVKHQPEVEEMVKMEQDLPAGGEFKGRMIKKVRSLAKIRGANSSSTSLAGSRNASVDVPYDAEEMKRARQAYETSKTPTNRNSSK